MLKQYGTHSTQSASNRKAISHNAMRIERVSERASDTGVFFFVLLSSRFRTQNAWCDLKYVSFNLRVGTHKYNNYAHSRINPNRRRNSLNILAGAENEKREARRKHTENRNEKCLKSLTLKRNNMLCCAAYDSFSLLLLLSVRSFRSLLAPSVLAVLVYALARAHGIVVAHRVFALSEFSELATKADRAHVNVKNGKELKN